jgi:hypothetical protein
MQMPVQALLYTVQTRHAHLESGLVKVTHSMTLGSSQDDSADRLQWDYEVKECCSLTAESFMAAAAGEDNALNCPKTMTRNLGDEVEG